MNKIVEKKVLEVISQISGARISKYEFYRKVGYSPLVCDVALDKLKSEGRINYSTILCDGPFTSTSRILFEAELLRTAEYRIVGRSKKDDQLYIIESDSSWSLEDAENRLKELESDNELLDLDIQSREVTRWTKALRLPIIKSREELLDKLEIECDEFYYNFCTDKDISDAEEEFDYNYDKVFEKLVSIIEFRCSN